MKFIINDDNSSVPIPVAVAGSEPIERQGQKFMLKYLRPVILSTKIINSR